MKISELKQPYRRMAEYLGDENTTISHSLSNYFFRFYNKMHKGENPEITEEIKKHFPTDFDFSGEGEEVQNKKYDANFRYISDSCLLNEILPLIFNRRDILNSSDFNDWFNSDFLRFLFNTKNNVIKNFNVIYTQLAKEGKFDELPDTCEFSEPVELEVASYKDLTIVRKEIYGKFKGNYVTDVYISPLTFAQLPTKKIDFSHFKAGDVVEVELSHEEKRIGWFDYVDRGHVVIKTLKRKGNQVCNGGNCSGSKMFNLEKIKSITKIK